MRKPSKSPAEAPPATDGIFGPQWHRWRGATLHIVLEDEPPITARLDTVGHLANNDRWEATLTELNAVGKPVGVRTLPWPPKGSVRVLRAP